MPSESPVEYIRRIKSLYPQDEVNTSSIPPVLKELHGNNEENARKAVEALRGHDYANELLSGLKPGLPSLFFELNREGVIAIGEVNDPIPNAKTVRLDGPAYAIVFNTGLQQFLYRVTRVLSTRFHPQGSDAASQGLSFEDSCRILTDVFFWFRETGRAFGPDYPVTKQQVIIASMLATAAERFFLAHELGHVLNDLGAVASKVPSEQREAAWADEANADQFALFVVISAGNRESPTIPLEICYAGAEIALSTFSGLEMLGVEFEDTHPPAQERLNAVRGYVRNSCADNTSFERMTAMSRPLDVLFSRIVDQLRAPDWESFLERASADVMKELDRLLDQCTGGVVPDYYTFQASVPKLFDRLSTHRLYARVADAAAAFAQHMQTMNENAGRAAKQEAWVSFQKFKLFMNMSQYTNEPFKSLLEEALGINT